MLVVVVLIVGLWSLRHWQRDQAARASAFGVANPDTAPSAKVPLSQEERQLQVVLWGILGIFALLAVGIALALPWALDPALGPRGASHIPAHPNMARLWVLFLATGTVLGSMLWLTFGRWPWRAVATRSIDIAASPEDVWDALAFRDGDPGWKGVYGKVERLAAAGEVYRLSYLNTTACTQCGLPSHPENFTMTSLVEVIESDRPHRYRTRASAKGRTDNGLGDASTWLDHDINGYTIESCGDRMTCVTLEEHVERPKAWMLVLVLLGRPQQQILRALKAHLEGTDTDTLYRTAAARVAHVRRAERFCGCPGERRLAA